MAAVEISYTIHSSWYVLIATVVIFAIAIYILASTIGNKTTSTKIGTFKDNMSSADKFDTDEGG